VTRFLPLLAALLATPPLAADEPLTRIAFGSCYRETKPAPVFEAIASTRPEWFLWLGDNIYGDTEDMAVMRAKYQVAADLPGYAALRASCRVIGTWDDHDFGKNDAGKEYPMRRESQQALLDFLGEPADSPRRRQEGVYWSYDQGPEGKRTRFILLDTRYHRDPLGSDGTVLGEAQWKWLEGQLVGSPAQVHVIASSIQVLPSEHRFEKWANFPKERQRLLALLARGDVPPVILLSGDRHLGEISVDRGSCGYPLHEITSSSLNQGGGGSDNEPNTLRLGPNFRALNFGTLSIDWSRPAPVVTAALRGIDGAPQRAVTFELKR
jgi:alkaline phosphatase D